MSRRGGGQASICRRRTNPTDILGKTTSKVRCGCPERTSTSLASTPHPDRADYGGENGISKRNRTARTPAPPTLAGAHPPHPRLSLHRPLPVSTESPPNPTRQ